MNTIYYPKYFTEKITQAIKKVYVWQEIEELIKNENLLARQFAYGNLGQKQFNKKLSQIQAKTPSLIVTSLAELDMVMRYLKVTDDIRSGTLGEMQLKAEQSEEKGFATRFSVWFYKSISGRFAAYCGLQIDLK